jgi:soluble lytic murein transglycosylase
MGMMQILPSTGRLIARSLRQKKFTAKKLYDPNINITFGVYHFANLVQRYGRVELALAAYNAGSGRVESWRSQFSTEDIHEWVESIPITETRNYVKNIVCLADHYRKIYTSQ